MASRSNKPTSYRYKAPELPGTIIRCTWQQKINATQQQISRVKRGAGGGRTRKASVIGSSRLSPDRRLGICSPRTFENKGDRSHPLRPRQTMRCGSMPFTRTGGERY